MKALTGKAFKAFKAYIKKENGWTNEDFNNHYNCQCYNKYTIADIIEWLDSVGIYVGVTHDDDGKHSDFMVFVNTSFVGFYHTRKQATDKAIIKAVEIYNNM